MLSKSKSKQIHLAKYLLLFPMVIVMLLYTSCSNEEKIINTEELSVSKQIELLKQSLDGRTLTKDESEEIFQLIAQNSELTGNAYEAIKKGGLSKEISFSEIDTPPIYPGCEALISNQEQKKCFSQNINKLIIENFNVNIGKSKGLSGKQKIFVKFTINKNGNIVNINARAPYPELEKEAKRVISLIPKLQPGKQKNKSVAVIFTLPIQFNIKK